MAKTKVIAVMLMRHLLFRQVKKPKRPNPKKQQANQSLPLRPSNLLKQSKRKKILIEHQVLMSLLMFLSVLKTILPMKRKLLLKFLKK